MHRVDIKPFLYVIGALTAAVWFGLLWFNGVDVQVDVLGAGKQLSTALSIMSIFAFGFIKWFWKIPFLPEWLVPIPNLNGTWTGQLHSTWVHPETKERIGPIPVALVIDQTFLRCTCTLYTKESSSISYESGFVIGDDNSKRLSFNYTNTAKVVHRERSQTHNGTALLKIVNHPHRALEGEYWTTRKTTGDILLKFETKKKWEKVPDSFSHPNEPPTPES
ncbi:MAG: hypothetical protein RIR26_2727 [Pseudomonadota bacterium]|jgi:hypothetical protein